MSQPANSSRPLVIAAIMASMFMIATEATIVSTAMPQIVAQLGGLRIYSWVFASFLLTQTAMTVVFGKLADIYGRKPVMLTSIGIFLVGSILAGFAWSMPVLVACRLVQGVGAGGVQPIAMTIVADLYPARERGKVQGYLASVWAISAVVGPVIGGLIIRNLSWAWVFWIGVPVGLAAFAGFLAFLHEDVAHKGRAIDIAGAALFTLAITALMIALTDSAQISLLLGVFIFCVSSALFYLQEQRAADPMISFALWGHRAIAATNGVGLLASMALMGLTTFLPMFVQGVLHGSPVVAGLALTTMLVGWPAGATVAARTFHIFGLRRTLIAGSALLPAGALIFALLTAESSPAMAGLGSLVMGLGMGLVSVSSLVLIQEMVPWTQRASATASNIFARNLGSTIGATVLGAVLNYSLAHRLGSQTVSSDQLRELLQNESVGSLAQIFDALQHGLHATFVAMLLMSLLIVFIAILIPPVAISLGSGRAKPP
jgi:MFS family permease